MSSNTAAWLTAEKARPFEVKAAPDWTPSENEILVKNHAVAMNPVDGYIQALAFFPMKYPTILGQDVAGEVVAVGSDVKRFKQGDRVLGQAPGIVTGEVRETAFQAYTILQSRMASEIPEGLPYVNAAVLPCGLSTSASAFFQEAPFLHMQYPTEPAQKPTGKTVLIWGGSSSVGSNGIQLAVAAGYEVVSTASPKNFQYVKKLGASQVVDYNNATAVDDVLSACKGKIMAGALDCIGGSATVSCMAIMQKLDGNRTVVTVKPASNEPSEGVTVQFVEGSALKDNAVGPAIYGEFLLKAWKSGSFKPAPEPLIVGKGLEKVQDGIDLMQKGMSARKVVVSL